MDVFPRFYRDLCFFIRNCIFLFKEVCSSFRDEFICWLIICWYSKVIHCLSKAYFLWTFSGFDLLKYCVNSDVNTNRNYTNDAIYRYSYLLLFIINYNLLLGRYSSVCMTVASKESILLQIVLRVLSSGNDLIYNGSLYAIINSQ